MDLTRIIGFLNEFQTSGRLALVANDPRISFGEENRPLLLARYLPPRLSLTNVIIEEIVRFGQLIANDGNPLSPPQKKSPPVASLPMTVQLGHIDIAIQMGAKDWHDLGVLINGTDQSVAEDFIARWLTRNVRLAIESKAESQRAQALANATVVVSIMDRDDFDVALNNPTGHRLTIASGTVAAPAGWYLSTYDPFIEDILPMKRFLADKGYEVMSIIYSSRIEAALLSNDMVTRRMPGGVSLVVDSGGQLTSVVGSSSQMGLGNVFRMHGLPAPIIYDQRYSTQLGSFRYLGDENMLFLCATGQTENLVYPTEIGLQSQIVEDTLGYYGIGVSAGHPEPGLIITPEARMTKPVGLMVEAYQDSFPVITQPEAIACLKIPVPTP